MDLLSNDSVATSCSTRKGVSVQQLRFLLHSHVGTQRLAPPSPGDLEGTCHRVAHPLVAFAFTQQ